MARTAKLEVKGRDLLASLRGLCQGLLGEGQMSALLVAQHLPGNHTVMPTLVSNPEKLDGVDPLAPAFPLNAARMVSKLTRRPLDGQLAVVLRSCEIRAFIELVKLKQGSLDQVVLVGIDCLGAYSNVNYPRFAVEGAPAATMRFVENALAGNGTACGDFDLSTACQACESPIPEGADLLIGLLGMDLTDHLLLQANTPKGEDLLGKLNLPPAVEPERRNQAIGDLLARRTSFRDQMFAATSEASSDLEKLTAYFANCVNCYNCRVACPVCYCKECVFVTNVFEYEPIQYLKWAKRKGIIKMPTDTLFYHLTRMVHMSTACVGCGQCSNACPNNVPVMEIFRTIASLTQRAFDYEAGRSVAEEPPLAVFREGEFSEVTGGKD